MFVEGSQITLYLVETKSVRIGSRVNVGYVDNVHNMIGIYVRSQTMTSTPISICCWCRWISERWLCSRDRPESEPSGIKKCLELTQTRLIEAKRGRHGLDMSWPEIGIHKGRIHGKCLPQVGKLATFHQRHCHECHIPVATRPNNQLTTLITKQME